MFASDGRDCLDEIDAQVFRNKGKACVSLRILSYIRAVCWPAHLCIPPCPVSVGVPFSETSKFMPIPPSSPSSPSLPMSQPPSNLSNDRRVVYHLRPFRRRLIKWDCRVLKRDYLGDSYPISRYEERNFLVPINHDMRERIP